MGAETLSTFSGLFSQESSLPDLPSPVSPGQLSYTVNSSNTSPSKIQTPLCASIDHEGDLREPEVRSSFTFSDAEHAARFHLAAITEANRAALNLPPTTRANDAALNIDTLLASLPGPLPTGTCVIVEPE